NKITPHQLRHFFCTNALENGFAVHEVANLAGHSSIQTTLIYTNPSREKMKGKLELL
ncbi:MAG: site-specific integrase, partial [Clostridiaceae bacterium]|nr:site-specific integrase [Clostridiaceae bacterium]